VKSLNPITDFQINLLGEFSAADFAGFGAHSLYRQGAAAGGDANLFITDTANLAWFGAV
jgi:hypothetical protein